MSYAPELIMISVFVLSFLITRKLTHPASLQPFIWLFVLISLKIFEDSFYPIAIETRFLFVFASLAFSLGALIFSKPFKGRENKEFKEVYARDISIPIVIATGYSITQIITYMPFSLSVDYFSNLRSFLSSNDGDLFGNPGTVTILIGVYITILIGTKKNNDYQLPVAIGCWALLSALLMSKFTFIIVAVSVLFVKVYENKFQKTHTLITFGLLLSAFSVITFFRNIETINEDGFILDFIKVYLMSGVPAFSESTKNIDPSLFGYTFRVLSIWANKFGAHLEVHQLVQTWVFTPLPTNIYTYLHSYYLEMGMLGALVIPFFMGSAHGYVHRKALDGSLFYKIYASLLMYPLIMQPFLEQYFLWLSNWIYFTLLILICTLNIKLVNKK